MAMVDSDANTITFKIVYWGVGLSGKTSNLQYVYAKTEPSRREKMISHATETERTLSFTFSPMTLDPIEGRSVRLHLITVPGSVFYDVSRLTILEGVDGIVFVVDTQKERWDANLESLEQLEVNVASHGRHIEDLPLVIQYNKRDLPNRAPLAELETKLNPRRVPCFDAIAASGVGVFDTLKGCAREVLRPNRL